MFGWQVVIEERSLDQGQAYRALESDSSGEEPTIVKIFVRNNLSIMHAAPKEDG